LPTRSKIWLAAVLIALLAFTVAALVLPQSYALTALTDLIDAALLVSGLVALLPLALRTQGRHRLFWSLIVFGTMLYLSYQMFWVYYEVLLRKDVPDLFWGDAILFLHIVPLMAAAALRPHLRRDEYSGRLGRLDFALLAMWWFYLYVLIVIPWQYVVADVAAYNRNLNSAYLAEKIVLLAILGMCWRTSTGLWRKTYASLFGANLCYSASSALANWAIARNVYYSGSLYDIPLACAMAWLTWIGLRTSAHLPESEVQEVSSVYGLWVARFSMIAVFSLPLFAVWAISESALPHRARIFRLEATLIAAFIMGATVFVRQYFLERELTQLLSYSRDSFQNLTRLQTQVLQSEKLASIGQLVGGAAHELNNPITALLGYSDLLSATELSPRQEKLASTIGQNVRRTRTLVASLISFSRHHPAPKTPQDLNTLARTAIKLTEPQYESAKVVVRTSLDPHLPRVRGDSNQLLQVCLQLLGTCLHEKTGGEISVATGHQDGRASLSISTCALGPMHSHESLAERERTTAALGLSASQGILQEHGGRLEHESRPDGSLFLNLELPALEPEPAKEKQSTVPVMWQSRPFA